MNSALKIMNLALKIMHFRWDVGVIANTLQTFLQELEGGAVMSSISLRLDPAAVLLEPEPQGAGADIGARVGQQETDPLEDFRLWLKPMNLIRQVSSTNSDLSIATCRHVDHSDLSIARHVYHS